MIRHLSHAEIDKALWDTMLLRCANRIWYMQSWVLDIAAPGWEALVDDVSGAMMPLAWRRKLGVNYLFQPYGLQQQGVFAPRVDDALSASFVAAVPSRFAYWDIYLNEAMRVHTGPSDRVSENTQQTVLLDADVATLRARYSQGHRRNLRKPGSDVLTVTEDVTAAEFVPLFERTTGARFGGSPSGSMAMMERLMAAAIGRGQCRIRGMRDAGILIAAACFMEWEGRAILFKSANDAKGQERQAMFHIVDHYIADHADSGLILDFAGSNTASVARFNAGFGARSTVYLRLVRDRLPLPFKWFKGDRPMVMELVKQHSVASHFLAELRDVEVQKDPMRFRRNLERIGEVLALELSRTLEYVEHEVTTPLGVAHTRRLAEQPVLATILRAGLPMHQGLLNYFDRADNAFVSAYRKHRKGEDGFDIEVEYLSSASLLDRTLVICDPMLATGQSMVLVYKALLRLGKPKALHIVSAIASAEGMEYAKLHLPPGTRFWIGAIDEEMTAQAYIVPGLGDAGDLAYGSKM